MGITEKEEKGFLSKINIKKWGSILLVVLAVGDQLVGISGFSVKDLLSNKNKENDVKELVIFDESEIDNAITITGGNVENLTINNNYPKESKEKTSLKKTPVAPTKKEKLVSIQLPKKVGHYSEIFVDDKIFYANNNSTPLNPRLNLIVQKKMYRILIKTDNGYSCETTFNSNSKNQPIRLVPICIEL